MCLSRRYKELLSTSLSDSQHKCLLCNGALNDSDLEPDEFHLETYSVVRCVLVTCINGFLVVRDLCLGRFFASLELSIKDQCSFCIYSSPFHTIDESNFSSLGFFLDWVKLALIMAGWHAAACLNMKANAKGHTYVAPLGASRLFHLSSSLFYPFLFVLQARESLSHLNVAKLRVRAQPGAHRSLIS